MVLLESTNLALLPGKFAYPPNPSDIHGSPPILWLWLCPYKGCSLTLGLLLLSALDAADKVPWPTAMLIGLGPPNRAGRKVPVTTQLMFFWDKIKLYYMSTHPALLSRNLIGWSSGRIRPSCPMDSGAKQNWKRTSTKIVSKFSENFGKL